jgi:Zn ribbon nucleic-acid-binding protein
MIYNKWYIINYFSKFTTLWSTIKTYYGPWFIVQECVKCTYVLSRKEVMYNNGVCVHCGYKGPSACTIVDTKDYSARRITKTWWTSKFPFFHVEVSFEDNRNKESKENINGK